MDKLTIMDTNYARLSLKTQSLLRSAIANLPTDIQFSFFRFFHGNILITYNLPFSKKIMIFFNKHFEPMKSTWLTSLLKMKFTHTTTKKPLLQKMTSFLKMRPLEVIILPIQILQMTFISVNSLAKRISIQRGF